MRDLDDITVLILGFILMFIIAIVSSSFYYNAKNHKMMKYGYCEQQSIGTNRIRLIKCELLNKDR